MLEGRLRADLRSSSSHLQIRHHLQHAITSDKIVHHWHLAYCSTWRWFAAPQPSAWRPCGQPPAGVILSTASEAAPRESAVSYHCLFSLPAFVCFVKVSLSIIMNQVFFFILFLFILMAGGRMWWLMRGWNEPSLSLSPRAGAYLSISDGRPEG